MTCGRTTEHRFQRAPAHVDVVVGVVEVRMSKPDCSVGMTCDLPRNELAAAKQFIDKASQQKDMEIFQG